MALDTDLDPLGDGSLLQSFTFNNKLSNEQGDNSYRDNTEEYISGIAGGSALKLVAGEVTETIDGHGIAGEQDASFVFWTQLKKTNYDYVSQIMKVSFGGVGERYNLEINVKLDDYDDTLDIGLELHKGGTTASVINIPIVFGDWYMFSGVYTASTDNVKVYLNDVEKISVTQQMKWLDNPIVVDATKGGATPDYPLEQLMVFTKALTIPDLQELLTMNITSTPALVTPSSMQISIVQPAPTVIVYSPSVTITPNAIPIQLINPSPSVIIPIPPITDKTAVLDFFGDGSCKHLWNFDNQTTEDKGNATISTTGSISFENGKFGYGAVSSSTQYQQFSDMSGSQFTYTGWFKITENAGNNTDVLVFGSPSDSRDIRVTVNVASPFEVIVSFNGVEGLDLNATVQPNVWNFIAVVLDDGYMRLTVNEYYEGSYTYGSATPVDDFQLTSESEVVYDQVRVFSRLLNTAELEFIRKETFSIYGSCSITSSSTLQAKGNDLYYGSCSITSSSTLQAKGNDLYYGSCSILSESYTEVFGTLENEGVIKLIGISTVKVYQNIKLMFYAEYKAQPKVKALASLSCEGVFIPLRFIPFNTVINSTSSISALIDLKIEFRGSLEVINSSTLNIVGTIVKNSGEINIVNSSLITCKSAMLSTIQLEYMEKVIEELDDLEPVVNGDFLLFEDISPMISREVADD